MRCKIVAEITAVPSDNDPISICDPVVSLALAAMQSNDDDLRNAGIDSLAARPDIVRTIWNALPTDIQRSLWTVPSIACCVADLPEMQD